ncbi:hypothetical protein ACE3MQ_15490 [Paenibacillus lentus]
MAKILIGTSMIERSIHPALKILKRSVDSVLTSDNKKYIAKAHRPHGDVFKVEVHESWQEVTPKTI